ncbi:MAG: serine/threonine protein kinase [Polyangiaceae bacterium]|nr:serine/threonine protein kinase [Polyangiaceae bacterium]
MAVPGFTDMTTAARTNGQSQNWLDGRYLLGEELGRGGHGVVYRAHDRETGEDVAIKVLKQSVAEDPQYAVRLWREAESLRMLCGTSTVRFLNYGNDRYGAVYLVMELLVGETLDDHLLDLEDFEHLISPYQLLVALDPIARALHTAHSKGIVHRDIKPGNIFLVDPVMGGGVRLMDFGLAKIAGTEELTQAGMIAGSPSYIAPELWRNERPDHRIDVYSFAAVIFRALAGRPPFMADSTPELLIQVTTSERPRLSEYRPDMVPEIDDWVMRALALRRDDRYPYVTSMWNDLIRIVQMADSPSGEKARAAFRLP